MGLTLKSPLVPSASPLSEDIDNIKRIEDAGARTVVMHSLFEEQLHVNTQLINSQMTIDSQRNCLNPSAFERVQYMRTLSMYRPEWVHHQDTSYYFG